MDLSITTATSTYTSTAVSSKSKKDQSSDTTKTTKEETAVIYEKSSDTNSKTSSTDYSATIKQLKADQENRKAQLIQLVQSTLSGQGKAYNKAGSLADLFKNLEVDADTVAQAKKDIAEDGYWGVEQTSDRLVSMAQALAGGDKDKADTLIAAIQKGFKQATKAWGEDLPSICQDTLKSTVDKLNKWKESTDSEQ